MPFFIRGLFRRFRPVPEVYIGRKYIYDRPLVTLFSRHQPLMKLWWTCCLHLSSTQAAELLKYNYTKSQPRSSQDLFPSPFTGYGPSYRDLGFQEYSVLPRAIDRTVKLQVFCLVHACHVYLVTWKLFYSKLCCRTIYPGPWKNRIA